MPLPDPLPPLEPYSAQDLADLRERLAADQYGLVPLGYHRVVCGRLLLTIDAERTEAKQTGAALARCVDVLEQLLNGGAARGRLLADAQQALAGARDALGGMRC